MNPKPVLATLGTRWVNLLDLISWRLVQCCAPHTLVQLSESFYLLAFLGIWEELENPEKHRQNLFPESDPKSESNQGPWTCDVAIRLGHCYKTWNKPNIEVNYPISSGSVLIIFFSYCTTLNLPPLSNKLINGRSQQFRFSGIKQRQVPCTGVVWSVAVN